jgi:hypothetical protein
MIRTIAVPQAPQVGAACLQEEVDHHCRPRTVVVQMLRGSCGCMMDVLEMRHVSLHITVVAGHVLSSLLQHPAEHRLACCLAAAGDCCA